MRPLRSDRPVDQRPEVADAARQVVFARQLRQHFLGRRILARRGLSLGREAELVEQDVAKLLRAADVEAFADQFVDVLFLRGKLFGEALGHLVQQIGIEFDAGPFHVGQHRDERHFDVLHQPFEAGFLQHRFELHAELPGQVGVAARVFAHVGDGHEVHRDLLLAFAQ